MITRHDNYALIGRFLGRRDISREIGYPVYNDAGDIWAVQPFGFCSFKNGEIKYLWVDPEFRLRGMASCILSEVLSTCSSTWKVRANVNSKKLFLTFGFKPISSTKNFTLMRRE